MPAPKRVLPSGATFAIIAAKRTLDEALKVAARADVIIAAVGEMSESSGESASRTDLELPDTQKRLLEALLATGKPVVMLNFSGRPTVMTMGIRTYTGDSQCMVRRF